jgi:Cu-processing system permease protein
VKTDSMVIESAYLAGTRNTNPARSAASSERKANVSSLVQIRLIALKEFGDRFRSGWVIACVLVWLGAIGLTSFLGLLQIGSIGAQGYERTVISLLSLVQYLVPLLGLLLGHDLIVSEREERTLRLLLAGGLSRGRLLTGKFLGAFLTLTVPLVLGFVLAGTVIGLAARDSGIAPFARLAISGLALGILFLGIGLMISTWCRTRVQALVAALLTWCLFIFVFDLVALGMVVSAKAPAASREIELVCDATHVNAAADIHSAFDSGMMPNVQQPAASAIANSSPGWLAINPVDVFRAVNLPSELGIRVPWWFMLGCFAGWLVTTLAASLWKLRRLDL